MCRVYGLCLLASPGKHRHFHKPAIGEPCVCTVYHRNNSQFSSTSYNPYALACRVCCGKDIHPVPQLGRRIPYTPEKLTLTLHFISNIVSHYTKYSFCFKVIKLASKEKMQSISGERIYPTETLLHGRGFSCVLLLQCAVIIFI